MILLRLALPFVVWSSAFLLLYVLHALGCRLGWEMMRPVLLAAWLAHLGLIGLLAVRSWRSESGPDLPSRLIVPLDIAAILATLWLGVPILALATCGP